MTRRILIALAVLVLALALCSVAAAGESTAAVIDSRAATPSISLAATQTGPGGAIEARIEKIRGSLNGTHIAGFSAGEYRGKNVIIVQVESLNGLLINKKYGGREITPNLNKLIKQSWYWPNAFSETGLGNTVDAEFISNTSLYAPRDQATSVKYANRVIPALPRVLGGLGYDTFTMHPNDVTYWNRRQLYGALGFARYYDRSSFAGIPHMGQFGASDEELFKLAVKVAQGLQASNTPFYSQIITLSAHGPFVDIPESKRPVRTPKELSGSLMGRNISAESYSDKAIGEFVATLKATTLWDNSIVVIYGDHTAMPSNTLTGKNALGAKRLLGRSYRAVDRQRIPLIIHLPSQTAPVLRTDVAGQVDIMPTVADLVGADLSQVPHVGRSLFVSSAPLVPLNAYLRAGSFVNYRALFMPKAGSNPAASYRVTNGTSTGVSATDKADLKRSNALRPISDGWVMSLPTFDAGRKGWIPDKVARRAAKAYGFAQH